jgi:hypothetical protein
MSKELLAFRFFEIWAVAISRIFRPVDEKKKEYTEVFL